MERSMNGVDPVLPYVYQEFPRMVYRDGDEPQVAADEQELEAALEAGWQTKSIAESAPEPEAPADETPATALKKKVMLES